MADLKGLLAKVEAAKEGSRELDGALWLAFVPEAAKECWPVRGMMYAGHLHTKQEKAAQIKHHAEFFSPPYSNSIDAALALCERVLPGTNWSIERMDEGDPEEWFTATIGTESAGVLVDARSPALAILEALLRALIEQEKQRG